jgi:hypothetical protein
VYGDDKTTMNVYDFKGRGVAMALYNTDEVDEICHTNAVAY